MSDYKQARVHITDCAHICMRTQTRTRTDIQCRAHAIPDTHAHGHTVPHACDTRHTPPPRQAVSVAPCTRTGRYTHTTCTCTHACSYVYTTFTPWPGSTHIGMHTDKDEPEHRGHAGTQTRTPLNERNTGAPSGMHACTMHRQGSRCAHTGLRAYRDTPRLCACLCACLCAYLLVGASRRLCACA